MTGDAFHMTSPDEEERRYKSYAGAIDDAGIALDDIRVINAHGTSTPANDRIETLAIKKLFGAHAYNLKVSSNKSMLGHTLGAAGAIEAAISVLSLRDQIVPPTINCDNPGEGLDLDYVRNGPEEYAFDYVMSNSFGFGGTNGAIVFKKYQDD